MQVKKFLSQLESHLKTGIATEHTYRSDLEQLFNSTLKPCKAINEPKRAKYGAPDFVILKTNTPIGHVEAKDIDIDLAKIIADSEKDKPSSQSGKQLKRFRASLPNLLFTDGLEWHWFVSSEPRTTMPVRVATWDKTKKKLQLSPTAEADLTKLLKQFQAEKVSTVTTPQDLAKRLAQLAGWLRDVIKVVYEEQEEDGELHQQLEAFKDTLIPALRPEEFADMYAQTIVYGLFAARCMVPDKNKFTRFDAATAIPKTNPFLRKLFQTVVGFDLDERVSWLVDDCAFLLERTDINKVIENFGEATQKTDPVVYFYETFLQEYDPGMRVKRGVYYTPISVVGWIVRSVHQLLDTEFSKPLGLADNLTVILDPATGTATFMYSAIQQIYKTLVDQGLEGNWNEYVAENLLPRVFGFELLMAPYAVAHLKIGLLLSQLNYTFSKGERLGIYLTNALSDAAIAQQTIPFAKFIAEEGQEANKVKDDEPVMVVFGNPPYSKKSYNKGKSIKKVEQFMERYKKTIKNEEIQRQALSNDYIKFIAFAHERIERTGRGVVAFITDNSYLDGPLPRDLRRDFLESFSDIYILNLHGNLRKREDEEEVQNVFDIQQGVAIMLLILNPDKPKSSSIKYYSVSGSREDKYNFLNDTVVETVEWDELTPEPPYYLFMPRSGNFSDEWQEGFALPYIFGGKARKGRKLAFYGAGFTTRHDRFGIAFSEQEMLGNVTEFTKKDATEKDLREKFRLCTTTHWSFTKARVGLSKAFAKANMVSVLYRPFDTRYTVYSPLVIGEMRNEVMSHLLKPNLALVTTRRTTGRPFDNFFVADKPVEYKAGSHDRNTQVFPLYLYSPKQQDILPTINEELLEGTSRQANFNVAFIADVENKLGLKFKANGRGDLKNSFGPEDLFHYLYAVFYSPTYRERYAQFLSEDFPRLPVTSDKNLFTELVAKGAELVDLHLLRLPGTKGVGGLGGAKVLSSPGKQGIKFPASGDSEIESISYQPPEGKVLGRVYINDTQYFDGVDEEIWEMELCGHRPAKDWLDARKGRKLSMEEVQTYMRIFISLRETQRIMEEIEELLTWPLE